MNRPALLLLAAALAAPPVAHAGEGAAETRRARAVRDGLAYLKKQQMRDGSFGGRVSGGIGVTALSVLAFLAAGHQENRGPYGAVIRRGVDHLLKHSLERRVQGHPAGYVFRRGDADSRMHGHGYATQVFVLVYGAGSRTGRTAELRKKITLAIRVIERSQSITGGWGYAPKDDSFHEASVTVTLVQALRLARDAGFVVDRDVINRGLKYLRESQKRDGSFKYSLLEPRSSAALTSASINAMHGFGEYYTPSIARGLEFVYDAYSDRSGQTWPFYANYYTAQAFFRAGGRYWKLWRERIAPDILRMQKDGAWDDRDFGHSAGTQGKSYATAMSCLALSVQDGVLPLFQK